MKRWNIAKSDWSTHPRIDVFLSEVDILCEKYGFDISHEDGHGAFVIVLRDDDKALFNAHDGTGK